MNKKTIITLAVIALGLVGWDGRITAAGLTSQEKELSPANRITLHNGVPRVVVQMCLGPGDWYVSGGATVQVHAKEVPQPDNNFGAYFYVLATLSKNPNGITVSGTSGIDARPMATGWFPADPKPHIVHVPGPQMQNVYLTVEYYGQIPANLVQAFGSISAVKIQ